MGLEAAIIGPHTSNSTTLIASVSEVYAPVFVVGSSWEWESGAEGEGNDEWWVDGIL